MVWCRMVFLFCVYEVWKFLVLYMFDSLLWELYLGSGVFDVEEVERIV